MINHIYIIYIDGEGSALERKEKVMKKEKAQIQHREEHDQIVDAYGTMLYERVRQVLGALPITDDADDAEKDSALYLVDDLEDVEDALAHDFDNGVTIDDEMLDAFLDRHGIDWK